MKRSLAALALVLLTGQFAAALAGTEYRLTVENATPRVLRMLMLVNGGKYGSEVRRDLDPGASLVFTAKKGSTLVITSELIPRPGEKTDYRCRQSSMVPTPQQDNGKWVYAATIQGDTWRCSTSTRYW